MIDFTTANGWSDVALASGDTWSDKYSNLSITVGAATSTSLEVTINYGPIPCTELATTLSLAPASQSAFAGGSAEITATVTNNDGSGCSASTFTLTPTVPAGWGYTVFPTSLTLSSAQTDTAAFTVNPPAGTSPATYTASLTADHPTAALSGSDSASIHVVSPLSDIAITSVSGPANAEAGSSVNVNVTVANIGNQDAVNNINVTLADTTDGPTIGTQTIAGGLAPGASTTLTFPWNTSGSSSPADHTLTASHDFSDDNGSNDSGGTVVALNDPLSIATFSPAFIKKGTQALATIRGAGFLSGATVQFLNGTGPSPSASSVVVVDSTTITAMVSAPGGGGKRDRKWDVRVNSGGASATLAGALTLSTNPPAGTPPTVSITSPASGSSFAEGTSVSFSGTANDSEDGSLTANLNWTSSIDGAIGSGGSFSYTLTGGAHTITASVTDSDGASGSDCVSVTINFSNNPPTVSISSPSGGATFSPSDSITFAGSANDVEGGDLTAGIGWTSSINGPIGAGAGFSTSSLSEGSHTITASVTDSGSKIGADTVSITITVSGSITLSANGYKVRGSHTTDLSWPGAAGGNVEILRDSSLLTTTANDGAYTDATSNKGGRTYVYQVCETGGSPCSNTATVPF